MKLIKTFKDYLYNRKQSFKVIISHNNIFYIEKESDYISYDEYSGDWKKISHIIQCNGSYTWDYSD